ncbi:hypothetical protein [Streptomyces antibioticus]|uniref:hypothetical protein n=1 Tax=Streptomyces antibioticus TaxID=1890 RepID=UPI0034111D13
MAAVNSHRLGKQARASIELVDGLLLLLMVVGHERIESGFFSPFPPTKDPQLTPLLPKAA